MTTDATAQTRSVSVQTFDSMDDVAEPTTLRLVISGVVVAAMLLAAFALGW